MEFREISKKAQKTESPEKLAEMIKKARKEDEKLVKGKFEFTDAQGGWIEFCYRKFKGEPLLILKLVHGEICDLPMGIVKHLNNTVKKVRKYTGQDMDKGGRIPTVYEIQSRVKFIPLEMY